MHKLQVTKNWVAMEITKLEWSLKPITNLLKISGILTHDSRKTKFFLQIVMNTIVVLSLFTNLFFNGHRFKKDLKEFWKQKKTQPNFEGEYKKNIKALIFFAYFNRQNISKYISSGNSIYIFHQFLLH